MPRDASGNYTLPSGNPVVTGTTIDSSWANNTMNDLATEMQDSLSRSGNGGMLVPLEFADGSAAAPGITFTNEGASGVYRAGTNDVRVSVAGVDRAQFRSDATDPFRIWSGGAWKLPLNEAGSYTLTGTWTITGTLDINGPLPLDGATITGLNAVDVDIADAGALFTATDVEGALQEEASARVLAGAKATDAEFLTGTATNRNVTPANYANHHIHGQAAFSSKISSSTFQDVNFYIRGIGGTEPDIANLAIGRYVGRFVVFMHNANTSTDVKFRFNTPDTLAFSAYSWVVTRAYSDSSGTLQNVEMVSVNTITTQWGNVVVDAANNDYWAEFEFTLNVTTAGILNIQWAPTTVTANTVSLYAGVLELHRVD